MAAPALRISTAPSWWQSSNEGQAGKFQKDSSKNIHSPSVLLPSLCSEHLCPDALPLFSAPKGFLRAGSIYGFICSWVFGRREWFLILTNCTLPLVTQKSLFLKNISSASHFFWANTERIFSKKQSWCFSKVQTEHWPRTPTLATVCKPRCLGATAVLH